MANKQTQATAPTQTTPAAESPNQLQNRLTLAPLMALLKGAHYEQVLVQAGITHQDYDVLTGGNLWLAPMRTRMRTVLDQLIFAASDCFGLPRIQVPAEYAAGIIAIFVNQLNWMNACGLYQSTSPAEALAARGAGQGTMDQVVNPTQLFAIVTKLALAGNYSEVEAEKRRIGEAFRSGIVQVTAAA